MTKKLITFPVMDPKYFLPKNLGQVTALTTANSPPNTPNPVINMYTPYVWDKNNKPKEAKTPLTNMMYR